MTGKRTNQPGQGKGHRSQQSRNVKQKAYKLASIILPKLQKSRGGRDRSRSRGRGGTRKALHSLECWVSFTSSWSPTRVAATRLFRRSSTERGERLRSDTRVGALRSGRRERGGLRYDSPGRSIGERDLDPGCDKSCNIPLPLPTLPVPTRP